VSVPTSASSVCREWLVARRYLSVESLAVLEDEGDQDQGEVRELEPA
jgi:hypothetical protein